VSESSVIGSSGTTTSGSTADRELKLPVRSDTLYRSLSAIVVGFFILVGVTYFWSIIDKSIPGWKSAGFGFFTGTQWNLTSNQFGAVPLIVTTLATTLLAMLFATPIGVGAALALNFLIPRRLQLLASSLVELLAIVPSVIYGAWGFQVLQPLMYHHVDPWLQKTFHNTWPFNGGISGEGILLGGMVLSAMCVPIVTAVSRDVFEVIPRDLIEGAVSLGATKSQVLRKVVLPTSRSGVLAAMTLALGRALGETIALTFVLGGVNGVPKSLFSAGSTLASQIASELGAGGALGDSALFCCAVVLIVMVGLVNTAARSIISRSQRKFL